MLPNIMVLVTNGNKESKHVQFLFFGLNNINMYSRGTIKLNQFTNVRNSGPHFIIAHEYLSTYDLNVSAWTVLTYI